MVGGLLSININYSPQEQHCQRQATRLVLARECGRAYKQAHCTYTYKGDGVIATTTYARAFLFVL